MPIAVAFDIIIIGTREHGGSRKGPSLSLLSSWSLLCLSGSAAPTLASSCTLDPQTCNTIAKAWAAGNSAEAWAHQYMFWDAGWGDHGCMASVAMCSLFQLQTNKVLLNPLFSTGNPFSDRLPKGFTLTVLTHSHHG